MPAKSDPRAEGERAGSQFYYRRTLNGRDLLPAIGVGIAAGILVFYVARIYLEQTPLVPARVPVPKRGG